MVLASTLLMLAATPPPPPPDPVLRQLSETRKFRNGTPAALKMDRSGAHVFFLRSPADSPVRSLHVFEVDAGQARELLSAETLLKGAAQQLSAAEKAQLERQRVAARGLVAYRVSDDGRTVVKPPAPNVTEQNVGRSWASWRRAARSLSTPSGVRGGKNSRL